MLRNNDACGSLNRRVFDNTQRVTRISHSMADIIVIDTGSESGNNDEEYVVLKSKQKYVLTFRLAWTIVL